MNDITSLFIAQKDLIVIELGNYFDILDDINLYPIIFLYIETYA